MCKHGGEGCVCAGDCRHVCGRCKVSAAVFLHFPLYFEDFARERADRIYLGKCVSLLIYSKFGKAYVNEMQGDNSLYTFIQSNCRYTSVGVNFKMVLCSEL